MRHTLILLLLLSCFSAARAEDDEVRFKPKAYTPSKPLQDRSYQAPVYTPTIASPSVGSKIAPKENGHWSIFSSKVPALADKKVPDAPEAKGEAYKQEKQISVSTIKADPRDVPERKPFDQNGKKLTDADYKAPAKPTEKNPMLKPRQGIKETE